MVNPAKDFGDEIWLCLHFSRLALEVFDDRDAERPAVVVEQKIVFCSNRDNLEAGLAITTAYALYPDLLALERQPQREQELLKNLAYIAYHFTPAVVIAADNSLLLEIGSCRRLYRGLNNLLALIRAALAERSHHTLYGLAHTPKAAWLLARAPHVSALTNELEKNHLDESLWFDEDMLWQQLQALPVSWLQTGDKVSSALLQMGVNTLGDLHALPLPALAKRFGTEFVRYLHQLLGQLPDPQNYFVPEPTFQQGLAFVDGVHQRQMLLFPMKRLLQMLCDYLRVRQLFCHVLRWTIFDAHAQQAEIIIELSRSQNDWQSFLELSRIKLDQVVLREAVFTLNLHSADFFETAPISDQLFPDARDNTEAGHALVDKLKARLGKNALQQLQMRDAHWPEHSWQVTADAQLLVTNKSVIKSVIKSDLSEIKAPNAPRPAWLLPQPKPLREREGQPLWKSALTLLRGPERVSNHWWRGDQRDGVHERDYYVARTGEGTLCWIFRETKTHRWFLHGWFA
jgi:protein ImuB